MARDRAVGNRPYPRDMRRWTRPWAVAAITGLVAFGWLSVLAGLERRGLTWWDPVIIGLVALVAGGVAATRHPDAPPPLRKAARVGARLGPIGLGVVGGLVGIAVIWIDGGGRGLDVRDVTLALAVGLTVFGAAALISGDLRAPHWTHRLRPSPTSRDLRRLSHSARAAVLLAQEEAARFQHHYVGTEHLLLGLLAAADPAAAPALTSRGLTLAIGREWLEGYVGHGTEPVEGDIGLTPRARRALDGAVAAADRSGGRRVDAHHLLIALTRIDDGLAFGMPVGSRIDPAELRRDLERATPQTGRDQSDPA
jgi:hypothetical protein